ncbi:MAG: TRIC cation channel family protein [bacterium]|nr:TRIC cation channel family protein [bacterium]
MQRTTDIPNLATSTPLWLALLTVGVNAMVGALRGYSDETRQWDIVGVSAFALLMGLGGGFIRDTLLGNLPAESLRSPWYVVSVLAGTAVVILVGRHLAHVDRLTALLNSLALGLFAVTGTAYGLAFGLPYVSAILLGAISAVGGGVLVSVLQGQTASILLAGTPNALLAVWGSATYALVSVWSPSVASLAGITASMLAQYAVSVFGLTTRPAAWRHRGHTSERSDHSSDDAR